ncbi:E3 ubiquitin ligase BIG BROTHER-related [Apostasia shenzhenica]|uniref:RING-type E3 ubiquitin transferase n=1 Tax=Apostasia shenzhenica TaxID=1088818 RepID=A0A2I0AAU3_9ASPA|nr:E3 ubiquitin ligase BIG BROTHER-related [Apostasia shenzhenica]
MQGQRNSIDSIPESIQFERGSNSNSSGMEQSFYRSNPMLEDYLLPPDDSNMDYLNVASQGTGHLNTWSSAGPNSSGVTANQENHSETKMAHGWNTALSINSTVGPRLEERHHERTGMFSLENVELNLNNTPVDDGQSFIQNLNLPQVSQSAEQHAEHAFLNRNITEVSMCPYLSEYLGLENASNALSNVNASGNGGRVSEDGDGRARRTLDVRRAGFKRKSIGAITGESSASRNISADLSMPGPSSYFSAPSSFEQTHGLSFSSMHRVPSEWCTPPRLPGNAEISQRNFRLRISSALQHDVSTSQSHCSMMSPPSSVLNPSINPAEHSQPHMLPVTGLTLNVQQSPSSSRIGSSSISSHPHRRLISETNLRSLLRNGIIDHPSIRMRANIDHLAQDSPNLNHPNSSLSMLGNVPMTSRATSSSGGIPMLGTIMIPSEAAPVQYPRNLSETAVNSLFSSSGLESGHHTSNLSSRHSRRSASTQEPGQSSRSGPQGRSPQYMRSSVSVDRHNDGVSGLPLSVRSRDGRNRMIYEIRNALDLMRRGGNLRFEDFFILEHSGLYGRDLYDRHRDMRLDVDNMSYEELLALEERIGYVNTGLSEDTILKRLKQHKHSPCKLEVASSEQEPCCICREDYMEGEDIGTLECRHDFHSACIKQWLMIKNLCPICKTTALVA